MEDPRRRVWLSAWLGVKADDMSKTPNSVLPADLLFDAQQGGRRNLNRP
jgi:hypothetical protein